MKRLVQFGLLLVMIFWIGCASRSSSSWPASISVTPDPLAEKDFVLEVLRHVYRWHFDQSFSFGAGDLETLEVWNRRIHPKLDADDRSDYAEMWIPAIKTEIQLKRAEYSISELNLRINEPTFKITRVTRQKDPAAPRQGYRVRNYPLAEIKEYLFVTRTNRIPISASLRQTARKLLADYLDHAYPEPFTENQIGYIAPLSSVSNELWVFWETGRKALQFSADVDLTNPSFAQLSQLRMQVIDLDNDVIVSPKEVPGSNAFVTKDWVGRLLFNCILYGERVVRTPDETGKLRK